MDDVEVEVVDAPVLELLFANGLDAVVVVISVPEFGDEEEVGAFDYAFFNGAGDALAGFFFVAVVCKGIRSCWSARRLADIFGEEKSKAYRMHRQRGGIQT